MVRTYATSLEFVLRKISLAGLMNCLERKATTKTVFSRGAILLTKYSINEELVRLDTISLSIGSCLGRKTVSEKGWISSLRR